MAENEPFFDRIKKLFSTDVLIRSENGRDIKVIDANLIQSVGSGKHETNSVFDRYNRLYQGTSLYGSQVQQNYIYLRPQMYSEYDVMDNDAIVASALDIMAEESSLKNDFGEVIQIRSSDDDIQKMLYNLFYDVLNIEFNLWSWVRQLCKYGDFFLKLEIAKDLGIYNVIPYNAFHMERYENYDKDNPQAVKFKFNPNGIISGNGGMYGMNRQNTGDTDSGNGLFFDNYEIAHFRLMADVNYAPYGRSFLEPARQLFKQYMMAEDAMLIQRIVRAPERRIFYINIGGIAPDQVNAFMEKTISTLKRTPYVDPQTGQYNLNFNMQNMLEDFYIPMRGNDTTTKIDTAKGLEFDGIKDVEYLRDKLFAALRVPKSFMGYMEDTSGKATLAGQDIRFARTVDRIQRIILSELYKIAIVHLYSQGVTGEQLTNFELSLTTPSIIYDQERVALLKEKVELANSMMESQLLPSDFVYDFIFHLSADQIEEYRDQIKEDQMRKFRYEQISNEGNDPLSSGKSFGTPHDLASLYGTGRYKSGSSPVLSPEGKPELGRPQERVSNINTQQNAFGRDRLGRKDARIDDQSPSIRLEEKSTLKEYAKKLAGSSLLDENQIKD